MKAHLFLAGILLSACGHPLGTGLKLGDQAPLQMQMGKGLTVAFIARIDDCFSCRLQGGFVALRAVQQADTGSPVVGVVLTDRLDDTVPFAQSLKRERLRAHIEVMSLQQASRLFDLNKVPAIYLLDSGRVVREWKAKKGPVMIGRTEIEHAMKAARNDPRGF